MQNTVIVFAVICLAFGLGYVEFRKMLTIILLSSAALFLAAYFGYGRILEKWYDVNDSRPTPSHTDYDGIDRVPAHKAVLLGHHFSSVAGAGPVIGPIIAAVAFGWLPVLFWVIFGAIFIGGVHDFSRLIISIRHKARSIAEIAKEYMSPLAYKLFLVVYLADTGLCADGFYGPDRGDFC